MRRLIRRVLQTRQGARFPTRKTSISAIVLSIGRAADQAIFHPYIRAALNHARVTAKEVRAATRSIADPRRAYALSGELTYATTVGAGAIAEVASTKITLLRTASAISKPAVEISTLDKTEQEARKGQKRAKPTSLQGNLAQQALSRPGRCFTLVLGTAC